MAVNVNEVFARGGRELIDLLEHSVLSINTDVLLLYLIGEYRLQPQAVGAVALHDAFCAQGAPARISETSVIPPNDVRVERTIAAFRPSMLTPDSEVDEVDCEDQSGDEQTGSSDPAPSAIHLPPRYLFDSIANQLMRGSLSKVAKLQQDYEPSLTPLQNLPGGKMTEGQRAFVNHVWNPMVRPFLVSAGFWRVATIA